jgi:hypothetical protein
MNKFTSFSLIDLLQYGAKNKHVITKYLTNIKKIDERYDDGDGDLERKRDTLDSDTYNPLSESFELAFLGVFIVFFFVWFVSVYLLISNWDNLPRWAQFVGLIGVLPVIKGFGPIVTMIVVMIAKK